MSFLHISAFTILCFFVVKPVTRFPRIFHIVPFKPVFGFSALLDQFLSIYLVSMLVDYEA